MKKQYLHVVFALIFSIMVTSCGSDGGGESISNPEPEEPNTAPTTPNQVFPLNNTICINNNVLFEWNAATDAEGNSISYRLEISENSAFSPIVKSESSFSESKIISLEKGKAYYWRIKAIDNKLAESAFSPVMQFLTEGEGTTNHVPYPPTLVSPINNSELTGNSLTVNWTTSDVDGDALTFDVYFDTNENPTTKVSENQTATTYTASSLTAATKYYVKVVVKDDKGASSIGQIWSFTIK